MRRRSSEKKKKKSTGLRHVPQSSHQELKGRTELATHSTQCWGGGRQMRPCYMGGGGRTELD